MLVVDDKHWNSPAIPAPGICHQLLLNLLKSDAASFAQNLRNIRIQQPSVGRALRQHLALAQTLLLGKVRTEKLFHHTILQLTPTLFAGVPDQPMAVQRVADAAAVAEVDADVSADGLHLPDHAVDTGHSEPIVVVLHLVESPSGREGGVELEWSPADVEGELGWFLGIFLAVGIDGSLQPTLADVAPGSDGVGDHVDGDDAGSD